MCVFCRLTQMLEDVQKILSSNINEEGEKTLQIIAKDFTTLKGLWDRPPAQILSGKQQ